MTDDDVRDAYRAAARPQSRSDCPKSQALVDFASGSRIDSAIADHLGNCTACAEEYQALHAIAPRTQTFPQRSQRGWQMAAAALLVTSLFLGNEVRKSRRAPSGAPPTSAARSLPSAASIAAEVGGAPQNLAIVDLLPRSAVTRGGDDDAHSTPSGEQFAVILNLDGGAKHDDYALDVVAPDGKVISSTRGLTRSPNETFTVLLSRPAADRCELRLYGIRGESRELMESYKLRLR